MRTRLFAAAVPAVLVVFASGCNCGARWSGGDGGLPTCTGTPRISPRDPVVEVVDGQPPPTVQLSTGSTVEWSISPSTLGSLDSTGLFTPNGTLGGAATVTAKCGAATDTTSVTVKLSVFQNGAPPGGSADAGAGGWGGVGGEGMGPKVSEAVLAVLRSAPVADPGLTFLYPYEGTVWPRGILAPLLQWRPGAQGYEAVSIRAECPVFAWEGVFGKTATPFLHHPVSQEGWSKLTESCAGQPVQVRLVFAAGGVAYGPLLETWTISNGDLKGIVYYNSYGTKLAKNYSGAIGGDGRFGGATLGIRGGSTDPFLVAGANGGEAECRVCHVVSADGARLLSQRGDSYGATDAYALKAGNAETRMTPEDGRFAWGAVYPDGSLIFTNAAPLAGSSGAPSALFNVPASTAVPATGIPSGLRAGTPVYSVDGTKVAFNWYAGAGAGGQGDGRSLAMMSFALPGAFSDFTKLYTPPSPQVAVYPSFLPTGAGVVFQVETLSNNRSFGETRSTCDASGPCSNVGAHGELWWVDVASKQARPLDNLNGKGHVPTGPNGHGDDATLNYEPTVGPVPSGGYAWVIFTSRRLYGNLATSNPFWSDPRFHDLTGSPTPKKLWVAAVDLDASPGTDPSHPAFYLPAQELLAGNSRGYWVADPCKGDGEGCQSGDQCCGGYCRPNGELTLVCGSEKPSCANEFERCLTVADCCVQAAMSCVNGRCASIGPN